MDAIFSGLSLIIVIAAVVSLLMRLIGQPLIIGYILTGVVVGPLLHVAKSTETLTLFSDLGIALLLFIIGLGLNPRVVREVGRTAAYVGAIQVAIITTLGALAGKAFGLSNNGSLFLGVSLAISSTIIILKLLSDKKEQGRLYGKIAVSVSLVQDMIAIVLVVITSAANGHQSVAFGSLVSLIFKSLILGWIIYSISNRVLPKFHSIIAGSQEFLFLFAIAWGLGSAALFAKIGLSSEIGALLAGICLAPLSSAQEIGAKLRPLRDFFLIVFFIALGSNLSFGSVGSMLMLVFISLVIAIIIKPLVAMGVMGFMGYTKRTSFKASVALAQISEFSIVLIVIARDKGIISGDVVSTIVFITLVSIAASTYMITFSDKLFARFDKYLDLFERRKTQGEPKPEADYELVLFGYQRGGHEFINLFKKLKKKYVVIDYDPDIIDVLENRKLNYLYGDATDPELLEEAGLHKARLVVSTIPDIDVNGLLLKYLEQKNPRAVSIVHADDPTDAAKLYDQGATYVILPHYIGSEKVSEFISKSGLTKSAFKKQRTRHLAYLEKHYGALEKLSELHHQKIGRAIVSSLARR